MIEFAPTFNGDQEAMAALDRLVQTLREAKDLSRVNSQDLRRLVVAEHKAAKTKSQLNAVAAFSVLCDLVSQGWNLGVVDGKLSVSPPPPPGDRDTHKHKMRQALFVGREEQLLEPTVRAFINAMTRTGGSTKTLPITALFRDGVDLAAKLKFAAASPESERENKLAEVIKPYLQIINSNDRCQFTGIRLTDVWRYFRYTWSTANRSVPGRSMQILVRDAAAPNHPVIGIASLASAVVAQDSRDRKIGWLLDDLATTILTNRSPSHVKWIKRTLETLISRIYIADFLSEGRVTAHLLKRPDESTIVGLQALADSINPGEIDGVVGSWMSTLPEYEREARSPLFTKKRAETLADLLTIRRTLQKSGFLTKEAVQESDIASLKEALRRFVRQVKSETVGINMMEINVCGAVPPYNSLLGGKLVAMLMASPEVRVEYERRYQGAESVIASKMAGRAVTKKPRLVMLGTSALYGGGLNQYSGISVPGHLFGGSQTVRYRYCGETKSYSTFQFSQLTMSLLQESAKADSGRTQIKSKFGEGVNPRMRKVRQELDRLGLDSDRLLRTESSRSVYIVPLATNSLDILLGRTENPHYILRGRGTRKDTETIARFWISRWLLPRLSKPDILISVSRHNSRFPLLHGSYVRLPSLEAEQRHLELAFEEETEFEELEI